MHEVDEAWLAVHSAHADMKRVRFVIGDGNRYMYTV